VATGYDDLIERLRTAAHPNRRVPEDFRAYVDSVRSHAYLVTDADVEALKAAGHDEDAIFEQTVAAAVAAGLERRDAALRSRPTRLGQRRQRRQARGSQDSTGGTAKTRGRSILQPASSAGRGGRLRPPEATGGQAGRKMRLDCVDEVEVVRPLGVLKTLNYRPELFGRPYSEALDLAMRGPSDWTPGERELFAAFVSSLNQCLF
jgi:hypothetical protein